MKRAFLILIFTATFVGSSYFTTFTGFEADQLPIAQIKPPIQPAGYAFAIWGLIYGWLIVSAVFGVWKRGTDVGWDVMRTPLLVSLVVGTPWLWVATQSPIAATVMIFIMAAGALTAMIWAPKHDRWWALAPVSIYAGWLTAASFVSFGSVMAGYGILADQDGWAYICVALALVVALAVQWMKPNAPAYGITVIWALEGIIVANGVARISLAAGVGAAIITVLLVYQMRRDLMGRTA